MRLPAWASVTLLIAIAVFLLVGMAIAWRSRANNSTMLVPSLYPVPDDAALTPRTPRYDALYVTTTLAGRWLERISAHNMGVRGRASIQVFDQGVLILRSGGLELFLPTAALRGVVRSSGMVGKFVADQSIMVVTWQPQAGAEAVDLQGARPTAVGQELQALVPLLDTGVRPIHRADRDAVHTALSDLISPNLSTDHHSDTDPKEQM